MTSISQEPENFQHITKLTSGFSTTSILNTLVATNVDDLYPKAAALAWVENVLGVPYSFQVNNGPNYIVPVPVSLQSNVPARWISDVAIVGPKCEWGNAHREFFGTDPSTNETSLVVSFADQNLNTSIDTTLTRASDLFHFRWTYG